MGIRSFADTLSVLPRFGAGPRAPAADDAAAASFATLTAKLGYLAKADVKRIREAYKFADEAHLGQFRASGEPTSRIRSRWPGFAPTGGSTRRRSRPR